MPSEVKPRRIELHFGALVPPLAKQLRAAKVKFDKGDVKVWQANADAITRLRVHGLLPDFASHAAHKRLMKKIAAKVRMTK